MNTDSTHPGVGNATNPFNTEIGRLVDAETTSHLMADGAYLDAMRAMMEYDKATLAETIEALDILTDKLHRLRNLAWRKNNGGVHAVDEPF